MPSMFIYYTDIILKFSLSMPITLLGVELKAANSSIKVLVVWLEIQEIRGRNDISAFVL